MDGIDPASWQVTVLPLPKRFTRGVANGFCGGHPAGSVEAARGKSAACWWPDGAPELLTLEGFKDLSAGIAAGDVVPGHWNKSATGAMGAALWRVNGGSLAAANLHSKEYERTWATAAGGASAVGVGTPKSKPGSCAKDVGLVWSGVGDPAVVTGDGQVLLLATDGTRLAGSINGRAALWRTASEQAVDLAPAGMPASEVRALTEAYEAGVAFKGMCARATLWRGTAASCSDLTPDGFETARIFGASGPYQVGFVRRKDTTRNGSTGSDNRASLWRGTAGAWFDLNSLLPSDKYNASSASALEIRGQQIRICGEASRYEAAHAGTRNESHAVPVAHPVLWTARLA